MSASNFGGRSPLKFRSRKYFVYYYARFQLCNFIAYISGMEQDNGVANCHHSQSHICLPNLVNFVHKRKNRTVGLSHRRNFVLPVSFRRGILSVEILSREDFIHFPSLALAFPTLD